MWMLCYVHCHQRVWMLPRRCGISLSSQQNGTYSTTSYTSWKQQQHCPLRICLWWSFCRSCTLSTPLLRWNTTWWERKEGELFYECLYSYSVFSYRLFDLKERKEKKHIWSLQKQKQKFLPTDWPSFCAVWCSKHTLLWPDSIELFHFLYMPSVILFFIIGSVFIFIFQCDLVSWKPHGFSSEACSGQRVIRGQRHCHQHDQWHGFWAKRGSILYHGSPLA